MKAIMISIRPEWIEKILNGEKTIEIRKTKPKCDLPCKVYIYCTKDKKHTVAPFRFVDGWFYREYNDDTSYSNGCIANMGETINGKVVAEFQCNEIEVIKSIREKRNGLSYQYHKLNDRILKQSCLTEEQILDYTNGKDLYGWHIDNLKIYDKPKELSEFYKLGEYKNSFSILRLTRPFQSWGYIEDLEGIN